MSRSSTFIGMRALFNSWDDLPVLFDQELEDPIEGEWVRVSILGGPGADYAYGRNSNTSVLQVQLHLKEANGQASAMILLDSLTLLLDNKRIGVTGYLGTGNVVSFGVQNNVSRYNYNLIITDLGE